MHTADLIGMGRKSCLHSTLYWNIVYWRDFLPLPTASAVPIEEGHIHIESDRMTPSAPMESADQTAWAVFVSVCTTMVVLTRTPRPCSLIS